MSVLEVEVEFKKEEDEEQVILSVLEVEVEFNVLEVEVEFKEEEQ